MIGLASWSFIYKSIRLLYSYAVSSPNYIIVPTFLVASMIVYYWVVLSVFCSPSSSPHPCWLFCMPYSVFLICVLMLLFCSLSVLLVMLDTNGCLSICVRMLSSRSVFVCLFSHSHRYHSADIGVGFMCCLLGVIVFL